MLKDWFWLQSLDPFTITVFILSPFPPFHSQLALWTSVVCECLHPSWSSPMRLFDFMPRPYRRAVLGWSYVMRYGGVYKENTFLMFSWDWDKSCFWKGGRWLRLMFYPLFFNLAMFWARSWAGDSWGKWFQHAFVCYIGCSQPLVWQSQVVMWRKVSVTVTFAQIEGHASSQLLNPGFIHRFPYSLTARPFCCSSCNIPNLYILQLFVQAWILMRME